MQDELFIQGLDKLRNNGKIAKTHPAKLKVFLDFLNEVFDIQTDRLITGMEKKIHTRIFILVSLVVFLIFISFCSAMM